jgi:hypothetical protein
METAVDSLNVIFPSSASENLTDLQLDIVWVLLMIAVVLIKEVHQKQITENNQM